MGDLETVVHNLPDAVVVIDPGGRVLFWLGAAASLFGWNSNEAVGREIDELLKPRSPAGEDAQFAKPAPAGDPAAEPGPEESGDEAAGHGPLEQELIVKTKEGDEVWVGAVYSDAHASQNPAATIVVLRDIWRRKRVDLEKSEVISAVAHELRSPLTSIKGFASTLIRRWDQFDEDRRKQILGTIETDADRVTRLVVELLDLSRLDEGRLALDKRPLAVGTIVERVVNDLRPGAPNHFLEIDLSQALPEVNADPDKVEQVLTNLVENAIKYTSGGTVVVAGSADGSELKLSVSDQGKGIPAKDRQSVFRKFFRRQEPGPGGAPPPTGSGLGLYISKGLIEAHGGRIWVEEAHGGGTVFAFTLPLQ